MRVARGNFFWGPTKSGLDTCLELICVRRTIMRVDKYMGNVIIIYDYEDHLGQKSLFKTIQKGFW